MQLEDLKSTWEKEMKSIKHQSKLPQLRRDVNSYLRKSGKSSVAELITSVAFLVALPIYWFFILPFEKLNLLTHIGMVLTLLSNFIIFAIMLWRLKSESYDDWTLSVKLKIQIERLKKEYLLLNSVAFWYLGPVLLSVITLSYGLYIFRHGTHIPNLFFLVYWVVCVGLFGYLYRSYRRTAIHRLRPLLTRLETIKHDLDSMELV